MKCILVATIDQHYARALSALLSQEASSHRVQVATTGYDALEFAKHIHPNVQIIDSHLPDISGLELYDLLCETQGERHVPTLLLDVASDHIGMVIERATCINKPLSPGSLLPAIHTMLFPTQMNLHLI